MCQWCVQHEAAQRGEDSPIQRVEVAPWKLQQQSGSMVVTQAIFGINVAVFLAMSLAGVSPLSPTSQDLVRFGANFGPYTIAGQWWRLLTCVFVHIGITHIALNMWCLWGLGRLAESVYDSWTFAAVYLITGISASVASLAWNPVGVSAGASGAIFGIAGALISSFYLGKFSLPQTMVSALLKSVLKFAGYNLVLGAMLGRTDNAAHVGGLVSGLVLGALIARAAPNRDEVPRRIGVLLVGVGLVAAGVMWLQHSHGYLFHGQKGYALLDAGKTDEAIVELQKSVSENRNFVATHSALARAYLAKHRYDDAISEMKRVIALDPQSAETYYRLGLIYLEQKDPGKAQENFVHAIRMDPNSADGHAGLAAAFLDQHRNSEALSEYQQVAAIDPNYQGVYYNLGVTQARLKLYDDAIASLLKQRQIGDDGDTENLLAELYDAKGMKKEAEETRHKAHLLRN